MQKPFFKTLRKFNKQIPAFDYKPQAYKGPSFEDVMSARTDFLNPGIFKYYKKCH